MIDVHRYAHKLEMGIERVKSSTTISDKNKELILEFVNECLANGITAGRIDRCLQDLRNMCKILNMDYDKATKDDIKRLVAGIEQQHWTDWTKYGVKVVLKKFYKVINKTDEYPELVKWIKPRLKNDRMKMPEDLISEADVRKMVESTRNLRDRAFVMTLYESGCRIGEILMLKIKHVHFDAYGAQLMVDGKTGQRRVRVMGSAPFLVEWINRHPNSDPNSSLWIGNGNRELQYAVSVKMLKILAGRAHVLKKVNPHNFRHSRATYLANHLTEAQMKEHFGWVQGSDMASVYVHLSGRDVDNALLKTCGQKMEGPEKQESELKPKECQKCKELNPVTNKFCSKCNMALDEETKTTVVKDELRQKEANMLLDKMLEDKEFLEIFKRKFKLMEAGIQMK